MINTIFNLPFSRNSIGFVLNDDLNSTTIDLQQKQEIKTTKANETQQKQKLSIEASKEIPTVATTMVQETVANQQQRIANYYETAAFELLAICNTLYTKASTIYKQWAQGNEGENYDLEMLWHKCWCPLLQGMARYNIILNIF